MSRGEYNADSFVAASGTGLHVLRRQPPQPNAPAATSGALQFGEVLVTHGAAFTDARWNRNNKVVAAGAADGTIQLLYSTGQVMCVLPRDGTPPSAYGAITSLSWSAGSKRLAAGSDNGNVYIHDMQTKTMSSLGGHLGGVTAVEYQHEDKFLAVASGIGSVVLYSSPHKPGASSLPLQPPSTDSSVRTCLALAACGDAAVAGGSERGGVAVWDAPTQRVIEEYAGSHGGQRVNALNFVPLRPGWLYSAGDDGRVCLQDRNAGPGRANAISVGAPATSLMVKEDHTIIGVGTADGVVRLYDPRNTRQPLHSIRFPAAQPVVGLHWQHHYTTLGSRHRSAPAAAAATGAPAPQSRQPAASGAASQAAAVAAALPSAAPSVGSHIPAAQAATPAAGNLAAGSVAGVAAQGPAASEAGDRSASVSAHASRAATPGGEAAGIATAAAAAAAALQRSRSTQLASGTAGGMAAPLPPRPVATTSAGAQAPPRSAAATPAAAPPSAFAPLAVTPLMGMAPPHYGGATELVAGSDVTPAATKQRPGIPDTRAREADQRLQQQQLSITPLTVHVYGVGDHSMGTAAAATSAPLAESPLQLLAAAPLALDVTPLLAPPSGRQAGLEAAQSARQSCAAAAAPPLPLDISPLSNGSSYAAVGRSYSSSGAPELCISPLPGMAAAPAAAPPSARQQRSVLGERSPNFGSRRGGGFGNSFAGAEACMLPGLASPLPPAGDQEMYPSAQDSPSFAENLPLPLPSPAAAPPPVASWQQQERQQRMGQRAGPATTAAAAAEEPHKLKAPAAAGGADVARVSLGCTSASGSLLQPWSNGALPLGIAGSPAAFQAPAAAAQQQQQQMQQREPAVPAAPATAAAAGSSGDFSFAAAQRSADVLGGSGAAWASAVSGVCQAAGEPGAAVHAVVAQQSTLRDDLLAMHLDMITQFQAQQAAMGQLVGQVLERNEALSGEVAALRRQLAALTTRREDFLWL